ncbi:MAG: guanitoxin biosynthesis MBL fold metallo-hydrolase GntH [Thiogranum sp.]
MKMKNRLHNLGLVFAGAALGASFLLVVQNSDESVIRSAEAAGGAVTGPNVEAPDRYVYYPGTEVLAKDEVRVIACGTGMPDARRGAASACFVFEFGNGEKMIFDIGTGSMRNIASLMIPYEYLTKVFISHLHTDHWGDLDQLWAGGWTAGRPVPLEVWGPSGRTPEMGTAHAIKGFLQANHWDKVTREYKITPIPGQINVHEFDYKAENAVIYDKNGIVVRTIPAVHIGDGPVSFIVEYAGMKLVFAGDTTPNKWFVKYVKGADFVIHEAFGNPAQYSPLMNQPAQLSWRMCCEFHTSAQSMGKVMSEIKPRHAVAYHTVEELLPSVRAGIRETYDGPLSIAEDMMVWNITKDKVIERMAVSPDRAWPVSGPTVQPPPEKGRPNPMSDFIKEGEWGPGFNAQNPMLDEYAKKYKLEDQDWRKQKPWYKPGK